MARCPRGDPDMTRCLAPARSAGRICSRQIKWRRSMRRCVSILACTHERTVAAWQGTVHVRHLQPCGVESACCASSRHVGQCVRVARYRMSLSPLSPGMNSPKNSFRFESVDLHQELFSLLSASYAPCIAISIHIVQSLNDYSGASNPNTSLLSLTLLDTMSLTT